MVLQDTHNGLTRGGVINNYLDRAEDKFNSYAKAIINPRRVIFFVSPHSPSLIRGDYMLDEQGRELGTSHGIIIPKNICIHHYRFKSREEWIERRSIGKADIVHLDKSAFRSIEEFEKGDRNEVYDDSMLYYAAKLNLRTYER